MGVFLKPKKRKVIFFEPWKSPIAEICETMSHFKLINSLIVNDEIPVSKYVSSETGVQVYVANVHSPITSAFLALGKFAKIYFVLIWS